MQKHSIARARAKQLPTKQLPLPGIEPLPGQFARYRIYVVATIKKHRFPIGITATILFLWSVGQGVFANGLLFAVSLHQINAFIDSRMGGNDDE